MLSTGKDRLTMNTKYTFTPEILNIHTKLLPKNIYQLYPSTCLLVIYRAQNLAETLVFCCNFPVYFQNSEDRRELHLRSKGSHFLRLRTTSSVNSPFSFRLNQSRDSGLTLGRKNALNCYFLTVPTPFLSSLLVSSKCLFFLLSFFLRLGSGIVCFLSEQKDVQVSSVISQTSVQSPAHVTSEGGRLLFQCCRRRVLPPHRGDEN